MLRRYDCERDGSHNERHAEDPCNFAHRRCRGSARVAATAATNAEATALRALKQHNCDQGKRKNKVDDQDDIFHGVLAALFWVGLGVSRQVWVWGQGRMRRQMVSVGIDKQFIAGQAVMHAP